MHSVLPFTDAHTIQESAAYRLWYWKRRHASQSAAQNYHASCNNYAWYSSEVASVVATLMSFQDLYEFCLSKFCICLCAHGPTQPSNYVQAMPSATDPDKTNYLATVCILCVWLAGSGSGLALEIRPSAIIQEHSASIVMLMHCSVCYISLTLTQSPTPHFTPSISRVPVNIT